MELVEAEWGAERRKRPTVEFVRMQNKKRKRREESQGRMKERRRREERRPDVRGRCGWWSGPLQLHPQSNC
jgi:hypothetical protein